MLVPADTFRNVLSNLFERRYDDAFVYADAEGDEGLYEGSLRIRPSGWAELATGRLLSPEVVHHVDAPAEGGIE